MTAPLTIYIPPKRYKSTGQRDKALTFWTPERLAQLRALCQHHASYDDLNAAFPGTGMSSIMLAMRHIIATTTAGASL